MNKERLISIIIPSHNRINFLIKALESVLKQSYKNIEIIIINDGSTDKTEIVIKKLIKKYKYKKISYFQTKQKGVSAARNLGISKSKGEWISFLDSDDIWLKDKLKSQIDFLSSSKYLACYTNEIWIKNGRHHNQSKHHQKYSGFIYNKCIERCIISPSSIILHRKIIKEIGYFNEKLPVCEDYDYWLRLTAKYPIYFLDKKLIIKQGGHKDQLSKKYYAMDKFRIKSLKNILKSKLILYKEYISTKKIIVKKAKILQKGYKKRNKYKLVKYYEKIINLYNQNNKKA